MNSPDNPKTSRKQLRQKEEAKEVISEKALDDLQKRIGYTFKNRDLLRQAFTSPSFAGLHQDQDIEFADNQALETRGDARIKENIARWMVGPATKLGLDPSSNIVSALNSNVFFSAIGIRLGIDQCVRTSTQRARAQRMEPQVRLTSDALEALVGAIDLDGGTEASDTFVHAFILPDPVQNEFFRNVVRLFSKSYPEKEQALSHFAGQRVNIETNVDNVGPRAEIRGIKGARGVYRGSSKLSAAAQAAWGYLSENPWLLWGYGGPVSVHVPLASNWRYGSPVSDQYTATLESQRESIAQYHEEDAWPLVELPTLQPTSTAERGPYIDKLRLRFPGQTFEVRMMESRTSLSKYAFYVDGIYYTTISGRRTLNDAAGEVLRTMYG